MGFLQPRFHHIFYPQWELFLGRTQGELCLTLANTAVTSLLFSCLAAELPILHVRIPSSDFRLKNSVLNPVLRLVQRLSLTGISLDLTRLEWIQLFGRVQILM